MKAIEEVDMAVQQTSSILMTQVDQQPLPADTRREREISESPKRRKKRRRRKPKATDGDTSQAPESNNEEVKQMEVDEVKLSDKIVHQDSLNGNL